MSVQVGVLVVEEEEAGEATGTSLSSWD